MMHTLFAKDASCKAWGMVEPRHHEKSYDVQPLQGCKQVDKGGAMSLQA